MLLFPWRHIFLSAIIWAFSGMNIMHWSKPIYSRLFHQTVLSKTILHHNRSMLIPLDTSTSAQFCKITVILPASAYHYLQLRPFYERYCFGIRPTPRYSLLSLFSFKIIVTFWYWRFRMRFIENATTSLKSVGSIVYWFTIDLQNTDE